MTEDSPDPFLAGVAADPLVHLVEHHALGPALGRLGDSRTDQRGVVHEYVFNSAGQLSADKVTTCPGGVDGTVKRIEFGHDDRGRRTSWTSYDAASGGNVVNQTTHSYSDNAGTFNSLTKIQQNHTGSVDANSPAIEYGYADGATSGVAQHLRRTSVTYPGKAGSRRVVYNNYPSSGIGAMVNRLDNLADDASGTTKYAQYGYFGAGSIYKVEQRRAGIDPTPAPVESTTRFCGPTPSCA